MKIPFAKPLLDKEDINSVIKVLSTPILTHGKNSLNFEQKFKKKFGFKFSHTVSSCTAGLHIALQAVSKKSLNVITSPISFASTANSIIYNQEIP